MDITADRLAAKSIGAGARRSRRRRQDSQNRPIAIHFSRSAKGSRAVLFRRAAPGRRSDDELAGLVGIPWRLLAIAVVQVAATVSVGLLADRLIGSFGATGTLDRLVVAGLICAIAVSVVMRYRERVDGEAYGQGVAHRVRLVLGRRLLRSPSTVRGGADGEVVLRFVGDLAALRNWHAQGQVALMIAMPVLAGGVGVLAWLDASLGIAIAAMIFGVVGLQTAVGPRLREAGESARRERARLARTVTDATCTLASIQLFGRQARELRRVERRSNALAGSMLRRACWSGLMRAASDLGATGLPIAILAVWLLRGEADLGSSAVALMLSGLLAPRIRELARIREYWELAQISRARIAAFLGRPVIAERSDAKGLMRRNGAIAIRDLSVGGVFKGLCADAPGGARVALVGPNGAGKSRLLSVLSGLEAPAAGRVVIDGQNATKRRLASQQRAVSMASADAPLVRGTVDYNIHYGARAKGADADMLRRLGGYEELLAELQDGAGARIGAGGHGVSAGQRARIALLRALLRNPVVLLLDEIEANLDAAGRRVLARVLEDFPGTIIMATHNDEWTNRCDHLWRLEAGALSASQRDAQ